MKPDEIIEHVVEEGSNDKVGYHGSDPGDAVIVPAGSIVAFSSRTFHSSGQNTTDKMRRSYLAQYSVEPIMDKSGENFWSQATPILRDGKKVPR